MAEIVLAILFWGIAAGTGMAVLRLFRLKCNRWENIGIGTALGLGLIAYLLLVVGVLGWLHPGVVWGLFGALLPLAVWGFMSFFKSERSQLLGLGRWEWLGFGILIWCAFFNIFNAMAPPFLADSLKYHLAVPKWYISLHQIQFAPAFTFNVPQSLEMIYTAGMLMHSVTVGLLIHYSLGLLAALGIWGLAKEFLSYKVAIWAAVFFYVGIPYIPHAAQGVDLGPIFFTVWAFYAFARWRKTKHIAWLGLAGVLAGLCAGTKYTGIYTPIALFFLLVLVILKDRRERDLLEYQAVPALLLFLLFGFLSGCPWYLKNWIVTGNPIYPIFYPLLGGRGWNMTSYQEGLSRLSADMGLLGRSIIDYLISPVKLLFVQHKLFVRGGMGLLSLTFVPAFFLLGKKFVQRYAWWIIFSLPFYGVWVIFSQHGRFLLPLIALWVIPCTDAAFWLIKQGGYLRILTIVTLLLGIGMGIVLAPVYASRFIPVVIGAESEDSFLSETTVFYQDIQWMNENLPADALVMSEFVNLYHLDINYIWIQARNAAWIDYSQVKTTEDALKQGIALSGTHIFAMGEDSIQEWEALVKKGLLERLYINQKGRVVASITMGITGTLPVAVYRVK